MVIGCSESNRVTSNVVWSELQRNSFDTIDFASLGGGQWTRICFLGPYNTDSEKTLGFDWQVSDYTSALNSDTHNVIVFSTNTQVIHYLAYERNRGDFSSMSGDCFERDDALFARSPENEDWMSYIPTEKRTLATK